MNKWDKYSWRIWNWILIFASSLAFSQSRKLKLKKTTSSLLFSVFYLAMQRKRHQKSWRLPKAGHSVGVVSCPGTCVRKRIVTPFLFFIVVQVHLSPFLPHHATLPHGSPSTPFGFVHVSFIHAPCWPFPYYPYMHKKAYGHTFLRKGERRALLLFLHPNDTHEVTLSQAIFCHGTQQKGLTMYAQN